MTTRKRRKKNLQVTFSIIVLIPIILTSGFLLVKKLSKNEDSTPKTLQSNEVGELFSSGQYETLYIHADKELGLAPMSNYWLRIRGLAAFQLSTSDLIDETLLDHPNYLDIAIQDLKKVRTLKNDRDREEIEVILGKALFAKGHFFLDSSIYHFKQALEIIQSGRSDMTPVEAEANIRIIYYYLGSAYSEAGDFDKSIEAFLLADGEDKNRLHIAVSYYKQDNYIKAYEYLEEIIRNSPDNNLRVSCLNWKAKIYFEEGKYDKAIALYNRLIEEYPHSPDPLYRIGMVYYEMNNRVKARAFFRKATEKELPCPRANEALMTLF